MKTIQSIQKVFIFFILISLIVSFSSGKKDNEIAKFSCLIIKSY